MVCPYCGGEINNSDHCEYCGRHITSEMKRELQELNKKGCPKCGSSNVTFRREDQGEVWDENSRRHILRTVGLCGDCGHTWYTDLDLNDPKKPPQDIPPEPPEPPEPPVPPKPKKLFWFIAILFLIILISRSCGGKGKDDDHGRDGREDEYTTESQTDEIDDTDDAETTPEIKYLTIDPIGQNKIEADHAEILTYSGNMKKEDQDDVYNFTPSSEGVYRLELSEIHNNEDMKISLYDSKGERVKSTYAGNGEGLTVSGLKKGSNYKIHISYSGGFSPYILSIANQKKTIDISDYTLVIDSMEFHDQDNVYSFTAPINGTYRFEFSEIRDNKYMKISIFNHLGERIKSTYAGNSEGLTIDLDPDETYSIHVTEYNGFTPYHLEIGRQKDIADISEYDGVKDSIEFTDQNNIYSFSPPQDGDYEFTFTELEANKYVRIDIYNRLGERLTSTYCENDESLDADGLERGETYQIHVRNGKGFSSYTLTVSPR